jgi:hypothetical protein
MQQLSINSGSAMTPTLAGKPLQNIFQENSASFPVAWIPNCRQ